MADEPVLGTIKRLAGLDQIRLTGHARDRMSERGATYGDVRQALVSATSATWQDGRQNYRVDGGADLDGDEMTIIVVIELDLVVVTIF